MRRYAHCPALAALLAASGLFVAAVLLCTALPFNARAEEAPLSEAEVADDLDLADPLLDEGALPEIQTIIVGFDQWGLNSALPEAGDEFYSLFSGPSYEDLDGISLAEYDTSYELAMPSGSYLADVTVGYGPEGYLDAIVVNFTTADQVLSPEQGEALAWDIYNVLYQSYDPGLIVIDSFPGGAERRPDAVEAAGMLVLEDELQSTAWVNWDGGSVLVMYATTLVSDALAEIVFGADTELQEMSAI